MHFKTACVKTLALSSYWKKKLDLNSRAVRRNLYQSVWEGEEDRIPQAFLNYCSIVESCCFFFLCPKNYWKILGLQNDGGELASRGIGDCDNKRTAVKLKNKIYNVCVCVCVKCNSRFSKFTNPCSLSKKMKYQLMSYNRFSYSIYKTGNL